ncbi:tail fiber assembly protein [Kosakonia pseudosacchari]|uniref:tail fiber assembly protein n=1 Tax=Kosakonia pseudosacchari TaxID=1646340 RepID=UPI0018819DF5|nr:tail fiber assembly protein [Kosakonia pseudosacchari]QOV63007.1 tail fiber assembly protein [Kosakonia pseudosacchari]
MFFNKSNLGFYDPDEKSYYGENWPDEKELNEIDDVQYEKFISEPPRGHILGGGEDGKPIWVEVPGQIVENNAGIIASLIADASVIISPLQDAVDMDIATEKDISRLKAWKLYRVQLFRTDTSVVDMVLPTPPEV